MKFTKMQGIGNDYIYVDCTRQTIPDPAALARKVSDRHFGVGGDGLILILPSEKADFRMRIFNADGGEAEMCGNGIRCVGKYLYERGRTEKTALTIETGGGIRELRLNTAEGKVASVRVDMGVPEMRPKKIPMDLSRIGKEDLREVLALPAPTYPGGPSFQITCVNMGNPHCVIFLPEVENIPIGTWGPLMERNPIFPERTNTEFVQVVDPAHLRMRVWERGSGETLACGTGACAALVAAVKNGLAERKAVLRLNGGELEIEWEEDSNHVMMTGPAEFVFDGEIEI